MLCFRTLEQANTCVNVVIFAIEIVYSCCGDTRLHFVSLLPTWLCSPDLAIFSGNYISVISICPCFPLEPGCHYTKIYTHKSMLSGCKDLSFKMVYFLRWNVKFSSLILCCQPVLDIFYHNDTCLNQPVLLFPHASEVSLS